MAKPGKFVNNSNKNANKVHSPAKAIVGNAAPVKSPVQATSAVKPGAKAELKPNQGNISRQAVAEAAYFLWLERGGNETVNWLEAEATVARKVASSK